MMSVLRLPQGLFERLRRHLLPLGSTYEEAAFLFARAARREHHVTLDVLEIEILESADFEIQQPDYLQLKDSTTARLIKRAHDLKACLVEFHSHPGPLPAAFSIADRMGFEESVPHIFWRLPKQPYLAIVVAESGFDAFLWLDDPRTPQPLDGLLAGNLLLRPTNYSFGGRNGGKTRAR